MTYIETGSKFTPKQTLSILLVQLLGLVILFATAPRPEQVAHEHFIPGNLPLQLWGGVMGGEGLASSPLWVQCWLYFLFAMAIVGVIFVVKQVDARWAAGGLLAGVIATFFVIPYLPIVSLGGMYAVMHFILWTPGLYLLLKNRPITKGVSPYGIWSAIVTFIILFSYIFDVRDSFVYIPYVFNLNN